MPMRRTPMVAVPTPAPREPWRAVRRLLRYRPTGRPTGAATAGGGDRGSGGGALLHEGWGPTDPGGTRDVARWRGIRG